jgi:hypothetical protein
MLLLSLQFNFVEDFGDILANMTATFFVITSHPSWLTIICKFQFSSLKPLG